MDPPKFCCVISKKSAQISQNFRAVTACGQRHHKFELLFPQLFERGAEDYVDHGRRGTTNTDRCQLDVSVSICGTGSRPINDHVDVLDGLVAGDVVVAVGDVEHGHCMCWSMLETSVRRPCAGCCTRMMIGAP